MTGINFEEICKALAEQLADRLDEDTTVYWYPEPTPALPCIMVIPDDPLYDPWGTHGENGAGDVMLRLRIRTGGSDAESSFVRLYRYLSHGTVAGDPNRSSVYDAVMSDRTLGGAVGDCVLFEVRPNIDARTADIPVRIIAYKIDAEVG